ncbi:MAG: RNA polymerase-binding protein DksA, partial [Comamonas sp.]|nr:RNA polymerase-binding protein DksA [Comamonas sp.]
MNAAPSKPKAPAKASSTAASPAPAKVSAKAAPASPDGLPVRSARPSSRLAQLTVPSIQQSVASTAAKASYTNTMPTTLQVPRAAAPKKDPKLANHWKTKPLEELTDADILAMPDSEYMNDVQMAYFRRKLVQLKQDMHNNAGETTEHLRE